MDEASDAFQHKKKAVEERERRKKKERGSGSGHCDEKLNKLEQQFV